MIISIGKNTEKFMKVLGMETSSYPFSQKELKTAYKSMAVQNHPDKGGSEEKMKEINAAFAHLEHLAQRDVDEKEKETESGLQRKKMDEDMFTVYESCLLCNGTGVKNNEILVSRECPDCKMAGHHKKIIPCKHCNGTGNFTLKSGKTVPCRTCTGSGVFRVLTQKCSTCYGLGFINKIQKYQEYCSKCRGTGKVKLEVYNPVIRKGSILV